MKFFAIHFQWQPNENKRIVKPMCGKFWKNTQIFCKVIFSKNNNGKQLFKKKISGKIKVTEHGYWEWFANTHCGNSQFIKKKLLTVSKEKASYFKMNLWKTQSDKHIVWRINYLPSENKKYIILKYILIKIVVLNEMYEDRLLTSTLKKIQFCARERAYYYKSSRQRKREGVCRIWLKLWRCYFMGSGGDVFMLFASSLANSM